MDEDVRWVPKAQASRELEVSISTLDRMIRRGEVEVVREGRRVYVRMEGPVKGGVILCHRGVDGQRLCPL